MLFTKGRTNLSAWGNTHKKSDKIAMPAKILKVCINVATIIAIKEITYKPKMINSLIHIFLICFFYTLIPQINIII